MILKKYIEQNKNYILKGLILVYFISHLYGITDPPSGYHKWRESDTAAVSESFFKETKNIFEPRTHQRKNTIGITGMEFPIYSYITGLLYHVFGFHHFVPRFLSILTAMAGLIGIYVLSRSYIGDSGALLAVFLTICSPIFFFYSRKIQPDIVIFTSTIWSLYFFIKSQKNNSNIYLIFSLLLVILGALIKPTALAIGIPMIVYLFYEQYKGSFKNLVKIKYILFLVISIVLPLSWNHYARYLSEYYGLYAYFLGGDQIQYWLSTEWMKFFHSIFISWFFEVFLGMPVAIGLIFSLFYFKKIHSNTKLFFGWVLGCYLVFFFVSVHMSKHHDYYGLIVIPPLAIITAYYFEKLFLSENKYLRYFVLFILFATSIWVWPRIGHRYGNDSQKDFLAIRKLANNYIPVNARITVEDWSPAIELYRLGRTGWTIRRNTTKEQILQQHAEGAEYAIFYKKETMKPLLSYYDIIYNDENIFICKFIDKKK